MNCKPEQSRLRRNPKTIELVKKEILEQVLKLKIKN